MPYISPDTVPLMSVVKYQQFTLYINSQTYCEIFYYSLSLLVLVSIFIQIDDSYLFYFVSRLLPSFWFSVATPTYIWLFHSV